MKKILLVEDTPETIIIINKVLNNNNYEVIVSNDGESAILEAEKELPDLILLDIMMPGITGYETCERLKENKITKDIPVIFTSALVEAFDKVKAFKLGAVDYIPKPVNVEELLARISTHLKIQQLQSELVETNKKLEETILERTKALTTTSKIMHFNDQKYRFLFNNLLAGIAFTNKDDGRLLDCNKKAVSLFGFESKDQCIEEYNFQKNYVDPNQREYIVEQLLQHGKLEKFELNLYKHDKSKIWIEVSIYYNRENNWFESIFIDITDRKD